VLVKGGQQAAHSPGTYPSWTGIPQTQPVSQDECWREASNSDGRAWARIGDDNMLPKTLSALCSGVAQR
jgi:hypothetical protein